MSRLNTIVTCISVKFTCLEWRKSWNTLGGWIIAVWLTKSSCHHFNVLDVMPSPWFEYRQVGPVCVCVRSTQLWHYRVLLESTLEAASVEAGFGTARVDFVIFGISHVGGFWKYEYCHYIIKRKVDVVSSSGRMITVVQVRLSVCFLPSYNSPY